MNLAPSARHLYIDRDYQDGRVILDHETRITSWSNVVSMVNAHNDRFQAGEVDYTLRVFCPWDGELHIPKSS